MKYRVVLEVLFNDGTDDKIAMYSYDNIDTAYNGFYTYMAKYVAVSNVSSVNVLIKDSLGEIYKNANWVSSNT